jgi:hypothetical protein
VQASAALSTMGTAARFTASKRGTQDRIRSFYHI